MFKWLKEWLDDDRPAPAAEPTAVETKDISTPIDHILKLMESAPERFSVDWCRNTPAYYLNPHASWYATTTITDNNTKSVFVIKARTYQTNAGYSTATSHSYTAKSPDWLTTDEAEALYTAASVILEVGKEKQRVIDEAERVAEQEREDYRKQKQREAMVALYGEVDQ